MDVDIEVLLFVGKRSMVITEKRSSYIGLTAEAKGYVRMLGSLPCVTRHHLSSV